ncbi:hypothetical protein [Bradyrhizobium sp. USDA 4454]
MVDAQGPSVIAASHRRYATAFFFVVLLAGFAVSRIPIAPMIRKMVANSRSRPAFSSALARNPIDDRAS